MIDDLNKALDYIEDNLTNDLSIENIAKYVGISDYHFRKIFQAISGMPLSEYIKKRKLSSANVDLKNGESVTEVAFKYGYHSVDGFSRAFTNWTDSLPSNAIHLASIKSFPKLTFTLSIRGGIDMEYRIENKPAIKFVGVS
ncbi:AraC family transcriptional regulator, partial [Staphylococcus sp. GDK8D68P]|uniref:helix-turn-helix transcriptional regulator n=1 Tax=Staphylococcus sp. GDK8D68P TaxID=2804092 RepID=UPI001AEBC5E1